MFSKIAVFEFRYQFRSWGSFAYFAIFFLLSFFATVSNDVQIGSIGNINKNSPAAIAQILTVMTFFGMLIVATTLSNGVLRDISSKMDGIIFSTPLKKFHYLFGRFSGGFLAALFIYASVPLGILFGSFMPWADAERFGPTNLWFYLQPFLVFATPNLLLCGSLFFTVATLTRSLMLTWASVIGFLVLFAVSQAVLSNPDLRDIAALADPFAFTGLGEITRYWTAFESNTQVIPLAGVFLQNRVLWIVVSLALLAIAYRGFSFQSSGYKIRLPWRRKSVDTDSTDDSVAPGSVSLPAVNPDFSATSAWQQFVRQTGFEVKGVIRSVAFVILLAFGLFNSIGALLNVGEIFGTSLYPVTRMMISLVEGSFGLIPFIVAVYYGAELVWRDRQVGMHEIIDSTPTPSWAFVLSKFIALMVVLACLIAVAISTAMLVQIFQGYTKLEFGLYLRRMFVDFGLTFYLMAVLSIFIQVLMNSKYVGMLVMLLVWIGARILANFGLEHPLFRFAGRPGAPLSDMNGFGHFADIRFWFHSYWLAVAVLLIVLAYLLWNRGTVTAVWNRLGQLRSLRQPVTAAIAVVALLATLGTGGYIIYNTNVLNDYVTSNEQENRQVAYEEQLRQYEDLPQPKVTAVNVDVDIYPSERRYDAAGVYTLENKTGQAIDEIHVMFGPQAKVDELQIDNADVKQEFPEFKYTILQLQEPLQPGEELALRYKTRVENNGFRHANNISTVVDNGSFLNNNEAMPFIGFNQQFLLTDRDERRRRELPPIPRTYPLEDESRWSTNYVRQDSDFIDFETTVSTTVDQTAIAPGYLEREWIKGDRRYFHYKMDSPILHFYAFLSADYEQRHEEWNGIDIDIYHHAPHDYNVDRMIQSIKDSIEYFGAAFSPYQHRQMRILEFPAYANFAQSFPNTVPYSEGIGFIADIRDESKIDYVYYVTAHEVAHQWWAHQVMGANVQGGTVLVETLAQYSALMVMEKTYGKDKLRKFLKYELDNYLTNRGNEAREELPLYKVENQAYIHYRKGSVVMYALQDYLGEDVVNRALKRLIDLRGFQSEPYATSLDLLRLVREEAGPGYDNLITDLFEKITIFDLKVDEVEVAERDDGRWDIRIVYAAEKFYADGLGEQTAASIEIPIDIGVFSTSPADDEFTSESVLYMQKHDLDVDNPVITLTVDNEPSHVGIDPYNKLIDRNSDDNLKRVGRAVEVLELAAE